MRNRTTERNIERRGEQILLETRMERDGEGRQSNAGTTVMKLVMSLVIATASILLAIEFGQPVIAILGVVVSGTFALIRL